MVRRGLIAVWVMAFTLCPSPANALSCTLTEIIAGICSVGGGTDGDGVDLWVDGSTGGGTDGGDGTVDCNETAEGRCVGVSPPKQVDKPESVHDLESFRPRQPRQFSEPDGWSIAGLRTNFVTRIRTHIVSGELAGHAADVKFTPVNYRRSFGDGASQSTIHQGSRWVTPWNNTETDHIYRESGIYSVRLDVDFVADYRFHGMDWVRLDGIVCRSARPLSIRVFAADTVLVARPCDGASATCR